MRKSSPTKAETCRLTTACTARRVLLSFPVPKASSFAVSNQVFRHKEVFSSWLFPLFFCGNICYMGCDIWLFYVFNIFVQLLSILDIIDSLFKDVSYQFQYTMVIFKTCMLDNEISAMVMWTSRGGVGTLCWRLHVPTPPGPRPPTMCWRLLVGDAKRQE